MEPIASTWLISVCGGTGKLSPLTPKDFAVLHYLVQHPGRLVTKDDLIEAVWPETMVIEGVLKVSIRKVRQALGEDPKSPQFIQTAHRRDYRFIGKVSGERTQGSGGAASPEHPRPFTPSPLPAGVVGREAAVARMRNWPEKALRGERQVVLLTGEAGIGKTTLVEAFLEGAAGPSVWIGRGQCLEHYGAGEDVLGQLLIIGHTQAEYSIGAAGLDRKAGAGVVF